MALQACSSLQGDRVSRAGRLVRRRDQGRSRSG
jgi:hypothetical protein